MISRSLALACSCLGLFLSGCSGVGPEPAPITSNGSGHCAGICGRATACGILPTGTDTACTGACTSELADVGSIGETVAGACETCLNAESCSQITAGGCASACPNALFGGSSPSPSPSPTPAPSGSCTQSWTGDAQYSAQCEWDDGSNDYYCRCYVNGVETQIFDSIDFCAVDRASQTTRVNAGCGWSLTI